MSQSISQNVYEPCSQRSATSHSARLTSAAGQMSAVSLTIPMVDLWFTNVSLQNNYNSGTPLTACGTY